ncbi:MAG: flagellar biosynthetic protein FliO [Comamonadaceae bacterium]|nr:MAG: flagellar biosynthetic protein FliO [Comamonadaceae bacterium]
MASTAWSVLMLFVVLALIPLVLWTLKKVQTFRPAGARALELAAQLPLGARERVVVVRMGGRLLMLGVTPQQVSFLAEADAADLPPAQAASANPGFSSLLRTVAASYTGKPPQ